MIAVSLGESSPFWGNEVSQAFRDGVRPLASTFVCKTCDHFENVADPRVNRGNNYPLIEMIFVTLCACIADADGWADVERYGKAKLDWLRKHFPFEHGIPSHDTFCLVFSRLDTVDFYASLQNWAHDIASTLEGQTVAFDGKTLRGSHDNSLGKSALHSVSAWVTMPKKVWHKEKVLAELKRCRQNGPRLSRSWMPRLGDTSAACGQP